MQRSMKSKILLTRIRRSTAHIIKPRAANPCHVFINHRGVDTKKNIAGLLYQRISSLGLNPFLDNKSMRPGDQLFEKIDSAIEKSLVGVAIFSPRYCESYFCLHELALMIESKKKIVPIFCDVKPSELKIKDDDGTLSPMKLRRFQHALDEVRYIVGITFDTSNGDWSEFLTKATDVIIQNLLEAQENQKYLNNNNNNNNNHVITKYSDADSA